MSSDTPQPKPQVSPDGFKYWDGSDWQQMPGKVCEWDGSEWKVKPSGIESEWSGKKWIAKPLGVKSRWNGTEWAVVPRGESKWDGKHYIPKPDGESVWNGTYYVPKPKGAESEWDGESWLVKPQGRAYWTGSRWRRGTRPIIKFGVPILTLVMLTGAIYGGLTWKATHDKEQAAGWTNAQTEEAVTAFAKSINSWNEKCYVDGFSRAEAKGESGIGNDPVFIGCLRGNWGMAIPANTSQKMTFTLQDGDPGESIDSRSTFTVKDPLGNVYTICPIKYGSYTADRSKDWGLTRGTDCSTVTFSNTGLD